MKKTSSDGWILWIRLAALDHRAIILIFHIQKKKGTTGYKQFYIQPIWQFGDCSLFDICLIYIFVDPAITLVDLLLFGRLQFMWCLIANLVVLRFHWGL